MNPESFNKPQLNRRFSVLVCTSPKAGNGTGRDRIAHLIEGLRAAGIQADVTTDIACVRAKSHESRGPDDDELILVTAGGDGTLALVAQNTPASSVLVPMPLGTENLLARHFGFVTNPYAIMETMLHGYNHAIDAGCANGKLFLVMMTCGFDAEVVRAMHLRRRGHINRFSYAWPILRTLTRYSFPPLQVTWQVTNPATGEEGLPMSAEEIYRWAMVFNLPRYAASLPIETGAKEDDGQLDFCGLRNGTVLGGIRYLGGIVAGRHIYWADVTRQTIVRCRITSPLPVSYQLDGDYAGRLPLDIHVLPKQITLRLPPSYRPTTL